MPDSPRRDGRHGAPAPIFLHIGAMKTGTTFLQSLLIENKDRLAEAGYLFPGDIWGRQVRAAQNVLYSRYRDPRLQRATRGAWQAMAEEMLAHDGLATIFSMEFLSFADRAQVRRIVSSLEPAEVHVVLTVRDAAATIPAHWQTTVRNGRTTPWPEFMEAIRTTPSLWARATRSVDPALVRFRRSQDVARMLESWRHHLPAERLHVVTVPPRGADPRVLWERFATVVGIDPELCASPPSGANQSLGHASTELLRRVNQELGEVFPTDYNATLRDHLAARALARRSVEETPPRLDSETVAFARQWNLRTRAAVIDSGASLSGDLDDLPVAGAGSTEPEVDHALTSPTDEELLAAAGTAAAFMRELVARRVRRAKRQGIDVADAAPQAADGGTDPVATAAAEIAGLCRTAIELKRRLRDSG